MAPRTFLRRISTRVDEPTAEELERRAKATGYASVAELVRHYIRLGLQSDRAREVESAHD